MKRGYCDFIPIYYWYRGLRLHSHMDRKHLQLSTAYPNQKKIFFFQERKYISIDFSRPSSWGLKALSYGLIERVLVRLPSGRRGVLSPNHITPVFFNILYHKDSEKLRVTFWSRSFLLENRKKVLKNHHFLENIRKLVFAHGAG